MAKIKIVLDDGAKLPEYKHATDAGADVRSIENKVVPAHGWTMVDTGIHMQPEPGWYIRVVPRSGLAAKSGIFVLNTPGTIDEDYRDSVKVILANFSDRDFEVSKGDRIAQFIVEKSYKAEFDQVLFLDDTERGNGGFGSTGIK